MRKTIIPAATVDARDHAAHGARGVSEHPIVACYRGLDSADAVQLGALLAGALDEPLVLAHAYRYDAVGLSARAVPAPGNGRRAFAARAALHHAREFVREDIEVREQILPSSRVAEALVDLARDMDACVLSLGRDTQGHVTRSLLPRAPCPVAIAPANVSPAQIRPFEHIGVACDGSPAARWTLAAASQLARATGARLVLLAAGPTTEHAAASLHAARLMLDHETEHAARALVGNPSATLTRASEELDLLVCGARGRGRPLAAILGSVSAQLSAHARCPVLVVPPVVWRSAAGPLAITCAAAP